MKKSSSVAMMAVAFAVLASTGAHAQTKAIAPAAQPRQEMDPAKRIPESPRPVVVADDEAGTRGARQQPSSVGQAQPYTGPYEAPARREEGRGGFFVGVQGGEGWVYDDVDHGHLRSTPLSLAGGRRDLSASSLRAAAWTAPPNRACASATSTTGASA